MDDLVAAGKRLLFSDGRLVWVLDVDGTPPREVMDHGPTSSKRSVVLALSPDGREAVVLVVESDQIVRDASAHGLHLSAASDAGTSFRLELPDGMTRKSVAIASNGRVAFGGDSFSLEVWTAGAARTESLDVGPTLGLPSLHSLAFSPRGRTVYAASQTSKAYMKNELVAWTPGGAARRLERSAPVSSLAVSPDGLLLAVGTYKGKVEVWVVGDDVE